MGRRPKRGRQPGSTAEARLSTSRYDDTSHKYATLFFYFFHILKSSESFFQFLIINFLELAKLHESFLIFIKILLKFIHNTTCSWEALHLVYQHDLELPEQLSDRKIFSQFFPVFRFAFCLNLQFHSVYLFSCRLIPYSVVHSCFFL